MKAPYREAYYRDLFAAQVGGETEVTVPFGRVDVAAYVQFGGSGVHSNGVLYQRTIGFVAVEVEPLLTWRHGARQALAYATQLRTPFKPSKPYRAGLAVYGEMTANQVRAIHRRTKDLLELWVLDGDKWCHIQQPTGRSYRPSMPGDVPHTGSLEE